MALRLSSSLQARFGPATKPRAVSGIDGSVRSPDYALVVPGLEHGPARTVAVEYKLYRSRQQGAGEMDRGLGQCVAYAEHYDAVVLATVYMDAPRTPIPAHWTCSQSPLWVERDARRVPVYFTARPLDWNVSWAAHFERAK
ncbi:hypothetical protein ACN28S_29865 [Cystobacter fuscus]